MFSEKKTHRLAIFHFLCNLFASQFNSLLSNSSSSASSSSAFTTLQIFFPQFLSILRTDIEIFEIIIYGLITLGTLLVDRSSFSGEIVLNYFNENNFQIPTLLNALKERWGGKEKVILEYIGEVELAYEFKMKR